MAGMQEPDLTGRVIVVTGANSGLGLETSVALAAQGATVVMTARDAARGEAAADEVRRRSGSDRVVLGSLDLASFASIRAFAAWVLAEFDRLDVLINNAGLTLDDRRETAEGFEMTFGVNHLGHFLLTDLLLERLKATAPARVVVVASVAHRFALRGLDRDDLQSQRRYRGFTAYCRSKLANVQFALELARRLDGTGVTVNAVHPGSINSNFGGDGDTGLMGWAISVFGRYMLTSAVKGARTQVMLAGSEDPQVLGVSGGYWSRRRRWKPSRHARNREEAAWLWAVSEQLVAGAS